MSLEKHKKYSSNKGKKGIALGEDGNFTEPYHSSGPVRIVNKNLTESDNVEIGSMKAGGISVDSFAVWKQMREFCKTYNAGFSGELLGPYNLIYYPYYREEQFYHLFAVTGKFPNVNGTTGDLRFIFCPDEPESWLIGSGIDLGADHIYFPDMEKSIIKKHFIIGEKEQENSDRYYSWTSGSGNYLDMTLGVDNDEYVTVTGVSGDHFLLQAGTTKSHSVANRMVSTNTLHPPPAGETGYAQSFQVYITENNDGDDRFYIAGSGVTGGCHLGGTFTGSGYTFFETPTIDVYRGATYFFNQHHSSNGHEYIMFSYTSGGHNNGGAAITGKYKVDQGGSYYCFNNYCHYHCPDEQTFMVPIDESSPDKIYYYASGTAHMGGTGYLNVLTSGDGAR